MTSNETESKDLITKKAHVISCLTDKITQKFYTELGLANFRLNHIGHTVVDGPLERAEPIPVQITEQSPGRVQGPVQEQMSLVPEEKVTVTLSKLTIEVEFEGDKKKPVFHLVGFKDDGSKAFRLSVHPEHTAELKALLGRRKFVDNKAGKKTTFIWSRHVVDISNDAKRELWPRSLSDTSPPRESPVDEKPEEPAQPARPPAVVESVASPAAADVRDNAAAASSSPAQTRREEPLLLAKSSYIQEGEENRKEAVRISKILRAFRWNVEPAYMIGVIFDGNVSIETSTGVISGTLVKQIEDLGYYLVAVNVSKESPTAWFKKTPLPSLTASNESEIVRELHRKIDEQSRMLDEERRRFDQERAGWEERFQSLSKLIASKGEDEGRKESEAVAAESLPEPDLTG